jgi:hypothetical protein
MANLICPKCFGTDYFMSQRNVVKGMGWAQRGSIKSIPVCRVCNEIMSGALSEATDWGDLGRVSKSLSLFARTPHTAWGVSRFLLALFVLLPGIGLVITLLGFLFG